MQCWGKELEIASQALSWDIWNYLRGFLSLGALPLESTCSPLEETEQWKWLIIQFKVKNLSLLLSHFSTLSLSTQDHQIFVIKYLVTHSLITISLHYGRIILNYWLPGDGKDILPEINNCFPIYNFFIVQDTLFLCSYYYRWWVIVIYFLTCRVPTFSGIIELTKIFYLFVSTYTHITQLYLLYRHIFNAEKRFLCISTQKYNPFEAKECQFL